ncbi:MFS transporter [Streptomyces sp. UH6]|uniref:MFS transporter n=1 Tax=Streptomyces sp. UH6 TaxID=2748379 RepID=UPI0015D52010|nr:MFS transporter [Streptomyces sp. UH6]NYV73557.1 MFS transporter [Streptomyces sp. UH6]
MNRRFRAVAAAYAASAYGNYLNLIALSLFSYEVTGTAFGVGAVAALRLVSGFAAGLLAGALSTRATRRTVMIGADAAQGLVMGVMALWAEDTPLWLLAGAVVVLGAGNTFFTVSLRSAIPVMVGEESRTRANGVLVTGRSLGTVLGFASAAPVIGYGGYALAFALNGLSFVVSAAALLVLRPSTDSERPSTDSEQPSEGPVAGREAASPRGGADGGRLKGVVAGVPLLLLGMVLLRGIDALASSSHNVALPVVAHATRPAEPAVVMTQFWTAWAVGTVLAHLALRRRQGEGTWGERSFALGTCAMSLSFVAAFLGLPALALVAAAAAAGFADGWTEIVYTSRLQAVPDRERGRLFGMSAVAEQSGFALGMVAAAAALEALPALAVVAVFHGVAVCAALVLLGATVRRHGATGSRPTAAGGDAEGEDSHGTRTGASGLPGSRAGSHRE